MNYYWNEFLNELNAGKITGKTYVVGATDGVEFGVMRLDGMTPTDLLERYHRWLEEKGLLQKQ